MSKTIARNFIIASLIFFVLGCIEGLVFPTKSFLGTFYCALMHIQPDQLKPFLSDFFVRIHTHISLVGWVSSALMGILYFIVPQIRGRERFCKWICYTNFWLHVLGVVVLCVGWHIVGSVGLCAGFKHGTADFTRVVAPYKPLIWIGAGAICISALLFSFNILRCLFLSDEGELSTHKNAR